MALKDVCFGFEAHQPFRLNHRFVQDPGIGRDRLMEFYFDDSNKEFLLQVSQRCYRPASENVLKMLDGGFRCAFSFSGTVIEQLERWDPDTFELIGQVARHHGTELIAQPYYHGIASLFDGNWEFKSQIREHVDLLWSLFGKRPRTCANTELIFSNRIAGVIRRSGLEGAITEGCHRILGGRSPNEIYRCDDLPVILRNPSLSNDISLRFADRAWDNYPLTASRYADWLAASPGDALTIFLNFETFGEHFDENTGIFSFLSCLSDECRDHDVQPTFPSEMIERHPAAGTLDISEPVTWSDLENNTSAFLGNDLQKTAFSALERGETYAGNSPFWRYLQTIDHFYYMASPYGYGGESHHYLGHQDQRNAFLTFMRVLADWEERSIHGMKDRKAAWTLRTLPPEQAFSFGSPAGPVGYTAYNLDQLLEMLWWVPADSIQYHQERGDLEHWIQETLKDPVLARAVRKKSERHDLIWIIRERSEELWNRLR